MSINPTDLSINLLNKQTLNFIDNASLIYDCIINCPIPDVSRISKYNINSAQKRKYTMSIIQKSTLIHTFNELDIKEINKKIKSKNKFIVIKEKNFENLFRFFRNSLAHGNIKKLKNDDLFIFYNHRERKNDNKTIKGIALLEPNDIKEFFDKLDKIKYKKH